MITIHNYMSEVNRIGVSNLPEALVKSHAFFLKSTNQGNNLEVYHKNETIRKVIDLYLDTLNEFDGFGKQSSTWGTRRFATQSRRDGTFGPHFGG